ncbi:MAG TPA: hypothetical protein VKB49_24530 [Candidatus Sulfotelmatobacter sp.]|jgi:hypothetical protein|nr:hypothetical protein [Candidatus Sulfotelmatobacter sp.]
MATLARQPTDPLHARIAVLIKQGFIVQGNEDGLVLTWPGLKVLMACAEPKLQRPKRIKINGDG